MRNFFRSTLRPTLLLAFSIVALFVSACRKGPSLPVVTPTLLVRGNSEAGERVTALAISASGGFIAAGGDLGTVWIWESGSSNPIRLIHLGSPVSAIGLSSDGNMICVAHGRTSASVWSRGGQRTANLEAPDRITSIALTRDSDLLVAGTFDGRFVVWNLDGGSEVLLRGTLEYPVVDSSFAEDNHRLRIFASNGLYAEYDLSTQKRTKHLPLIKMPTSRRGSSNPLPPLLGGGVSRDGRFIVGADRNYIVHVWSAETAASVMKHNRNKPLVCAALSGDGSRLAVAGRNITILDMPAGSSLGSVIAPGKVTMLAFSSDGKHLVAGCSTEGIMLIRIEDGR